MSIYNRLKTISIPIDTPNPTIKIEILEELRTWEYNYWGVSNLAIEYSETFSTVTLWNSALTTNNFQNFTYTPSVSQSI